MSNVAIEKIIESSLTQENLVSISMPRQGVRNLFNKKSNLPIDIHGLEYLAVNINDKWFLCEPIKSKNRPSYVVEETFNGLIIQRDLRIYAWQECRSLIAVMANPRAYNAIVYKITKEEYDEVRRYMISNIDYVLNFIDIRDIVYTYPNGVVIKGLTCVHALNPMSYMFCRDMIISLCELEKSSYYGELKNINPIILIEILKTIIGNQVINSNFNEISQVTDIKRNTLFKICDAIVENKPNIVKQFLSNIDVGDDLIF